MTYPTADELEEAICALESTCFIRGMNQDNKTLDAAREAVNTQVKALLHRLSVAERTVEALGIKQDKLIREHGERVALMEAALGAADTMREEATRFTLKRLPDVDRKMCDSVLCYDEARSKTKEAT